MGKFVCLYVWILFMVNHAETTELSLMRFGIQTGYNLSWVTFFHENAGKVASRNLRSLRNNLYDFFYKHNNYCALHNLLYSKRNHDTFLIPFLPSKSFL